jgi:hypothetical protein
MNNIKVILILISFLLCGTLSAQTPGTLYASTGDVGDTLITINPATGLGTPVAAQGAFGPVTEIEFRSDGVLFGSTGNGDRNIITIDPITGNETLIGMHSQQRAVVGLEFDGSENLLGSLVNSGSSDLVTVDQTTGQLTKIGDMLDSTVTGLAFSPGGTLYGVAHIGGPSALYIIDPGTGAATLVGPIGFDAVGALEFGPNGILFGGVGNIDPNFAGYVIMIDTLTGAGTALGSTGYPGISGLSFVPNPTSINNETQLGIAGNFTLYQNYPNPFNPVTHIRFGLPNSSKVKIEIFDVLGNNVTTLLNENISAGFHTVDFDASNLASGLYLYRIQAGEFIQMKKMVLMK